MVEKKSANKTKTKGKKTKAKTSKTTKSAKSKNKKAKKESFSDMGIVIVDDDIEIDKEIVNEERMAYLEESRSQESSD